MTGYRGRYSASQITTFRECPRKWGWDKLDGIKRPSNKFADKGSRVHEILEAWLEYGTPPPDTEEGRIAMAGLAALPAPGVARVEYAFSLSTDVADYAGRIDALHFPTATTAEVTDHKTTGNLAYAKTPEDLKTDVPAVLYSAEVFSKFGAHQVNLHWNYLDTKNPRQKSVRLKVLPSDVEREMRGIDETAAEMNAIHELKLKAKDLPPDARSCEKYGGCGFQTNCNLTNAERMRSIMTQMSFAEKMRQRKAAQLVNPPPHGETAAEPAKKLALAKPIEIADEGVEEGPTEPKKPRGRPPKAQSVGKAAMHVTDVKEQMAVDAIEQRDAMPAVVVNNVPFGYQPTLSQVAMHLMAASVIAREPFTDEMERATVAKSRAIALIKATT